MDEERHPMEGHGRPERAGILETKARSLLRLGEKQREGERVARAEEVRVRDADAAVRDDRGLRALVAAREPLAHAEHEVVDLERGALADLDAEDDAPTRAPALEREAHVREEACPEELVAGLFETLVLDVERLALAYGDVSTHDVLARLAVAHDPDRLEAVDDRPVTVTALVFRVVAFRVVVFRVVVFRVVVFRVVVRVRRRRPLGPRLDAVPRQARPVRAVGSSLGRGLARRGLRARPRRREGEQRDDERR
jgi:hypothetical protein